MIITASFYWTIIDRDIVYTDIAHKEEMHSETFSKSLFFTHFLAEASAPVGFGICFHRKGERPTVESNTL